MERDWAPAGCTNKPCTSPPEPPEEEGDDDPPPHATKAIASNQRMGTSWGFEFDPGEATKVPLLDLSDSVVAGRDLANLRHTSGCTPESGNGPFASPTPASRRARPRGAPVEESVARHPRRGPPP